MPWSLAREGETLHVSIQTPIEGEDWEALMDGIHDELARGVRAVVMPADIPSLSSTDKATLSALWDLLISRGVTVQRPSERSR